MSEQEALELTERLSVIYSGHAVFMQCVVRFKGV